MIEELTYDADGTARWIDREADALHEFHYARELVVNAWDAGATRVTIDGWIGPEGHELVRFSDNGTGMTIDELVEHGRTLHKSGRNRSDNYGIGGRLSTLTANPSGVTWASLARSRDDVDTIEIGAIQLVRERGRYGLRLWELRTGELSNSYEPGSDMLWRIPDGSTGTAVILHGNGKSSTYTGPAQNGIDKYLTRRFFSFRSPVYLVLPSSTQSHQLIPYGDRLCSEAAEFGTVAVDEHGSLAHWWVLPPTKDRGRESSHTVTAIAALARDELFDMVMSNESRARYPQFGITQKKVRSRVAILVEPGFPVQMSTSRGRLESRNGSDLPWQSWGAEFIEQMPREISDLIDDHARDSVAFDAALAKAMDPDWYKRVEATRLLSPSEAGETAATFQQGVTTGSPSGTKTEGHGLSPVPGQMRPPRRTRIGPESGEQSAQERFAHQPPKVIWEDSSEWNEALEYWAVYYRPMNQVHLRSDAFIFQLSIERFATQFPRVPRIEIEMAVRNAYAQEAAMKAIHVLCQAKHGWLPLAIEEQLKAPGLSASLLGLNAIESSIQSQLQRVSQ